MERTVIDVKKVMDGSGFVVTSTVQEKMTEADMMQLKNQVQQRNTMIKQQMISLKSEYDANVQKISEFDDMLQQLQTAPVTIEG